MSFPFTLIAGPCVIEDESTLFEIAEEVSQVAVADTTFTNIDDASDPCSEASNGTKSHEKWFVLGIQYQFSMLVLIFSINI